MSHDPEAVEALAEAFGRFDRETDHEAEVISPVDHACVALDALAAAGYTVTRGKYEPVNHHYDQLWLNPWSMRPHWRLSTQDNGRYVRLYRKIEGSGERFDGCWLGDKCDDTLCTAHDDGSTDG